MCLASGLCDTNNSAFSNSPRERSQIWRPTLLPLNKSKHFVGNNIFRPEIISEINFVSLLKSIIHNHNCLKIIQIS